MTAAEVYANETARESHTPAGFPNAAYVEWLERIVEQVAGMLDICESDLSIYDADDLEDLHGLFSRTT